MVSAEQKTLDALKASTALAALIGSGDQLRVFADEADQSAIKPYIVFERIGATPVIYLDLARGPVSVSMLITCWSDSRVTAGQLALLVEDAMSTAGHTLTDLPSDYIPELKEFAGARAFDVWEY